MICFEVMAVEHITVLSALSGGLYLSEVNLAGTHDSATLLHHRELVPEYDEFEYQEGPGGEGRYY